MVWLFQLIFKPAAALCSIHNIRSNRKISSMYLVFVFRTSHKLIPKLTVYILIVSLSLHPLLNMCNILNILCNIKNIFANRTIFHFFLLILSSKNSIQKLLMKQMKLRCGTRAFDFSIIQYKCICMKQSVVRSSAFVARWVLIFFTQPYDSLLHSLLS